MAKRIKLTERQVVALMTLYNEPGHVWRDQPPNVAQTTLRVLHGHGLIHEGHNAVTGKHKYRISLQGVDWAKAFMEEVAQVKESAANTQAVQGTSKETFTERVANRIRMLRVIEGMSQDALAKRTNLSRATVNSVEAHTSKPSLRHLELIGKVLKVEPWLLLAPDNHWQEFIKERV